MTLLRALGDRFGGRWTNVAFLRSAPCAKRSSGEPIRLCEAVFRSFQEPLVLRADDVGCAGARRALGLANDDPALVRAIAGKTGIEARVLRALVSETPRIAAPVPALSLGKDTESADVVVGYICPQQAMLLLRRWQEVHGHSPVVRLSSFMAICAWVLVRAHTLGRMCLSFGCFDSREYGGIADDVLVVGMPPTLAQQMM